jgi:hypothetical protein
MAKAAAAAHFIQEVAESEQKVLVGIWHHDVKVAITAELARNKINVFHYTGNESPAEKTKAITAFKNSKERAALLMNIRAGEGVEGLQEVCSTVVTAELDWSPAAHKQFVGRLNRPGQKHPVKHYILVVDDGSDPPVMKVLGIKKSQRDGIVDLKESAFEAPPEARLKELAAAYLERRKDFTFTSADDVVVRKPSQAATELASYIDAVPLPIESEAAMRKALDPTVKSWALKAKFQFFTEKILSPENRIDLLIQHGNYRIGIECKVGGDRTDVYRQLMRYAAFVDELILVCPWPIANFSVDGVPVHVVVKYPDGVT